MKWYLLCIYSDGSGSIKVPLEVEEYERPFRLFQTIKTVLEMTHSTFDGENCYLIAEEFDFKKILSKAAS